ncbi:MAG TPA: hypothetical protein VHD61_07285, partial [Lacunisphaera sp.]|nr:hypothetical protein [Lacunisphaera sp.]
MKRLACLLALLTPALVFAATAGIDTVVTGIPAGASEVVVAIDTVSTAPAADYEDPAAAAQKAVVPPVPAAQPAAAPAAAPAADAQAAPAAGDAVAGQRR